MGTREQDAWLAAVLGVPLTAGGDGGHGGAADGGDGGEAAALGKLADVWHATEARIHAEVGGLLDHLKKLYDGDEASSQMEKDFQVHFDQITATFDGTLGQELAKAKAARTADDLTRIKAELKQTVGAFAKSLKGDAAVSLMDDNPFLPLTIGKTCEAALQQMLAQVG